MSQKRLDHIVAEFFPQYSRSKAQSLIERGRVRLKNQKNEFETILKPGKKWNVAELKRAHFEILPDEETQYVSRGALKLKKAVESFNVIIEGKTCLDVGLSTGGFSDFLLQSGAKKVLGVDVGRDQLHPSLKKNPQLTWADKVNARKALPADLLNDFFCSEPAKFDLVVVDVSFISLEKIISNLLEYLKVGGDLICLIKPQFELEKSQLNKKGVVKDPGQVDKVVEKIVGVFRKNQLEIIETCLSPIEGENGNKEVLLYSIMLEPVGSELLSDKS